MAEHEVDPLREFDALLEQELSVTPSPEFLARVREAVRAEPDRSRSPLFAGRWSPFADRRSLFADRRSLFARRSPLVAPFAGAAAILVLATVVWMQALADVTPPPAPAAPPIGVASVSLHPNVPVPNTEYRTPTFALRATAGKPSTDNRVPNTHLRASRYGGQAEYRIPAFAEVIVDQRQRAALVSMLRLINQGQVTEDSFKTTTPAPMEIGVDPVALSPIVVGGVLPPESDRK